MFLVFIQALCLLNVYHRRFSKPVDLSLFPEVCICLDFAGLRVDEDGLNRRAANSELGISHVVTFRQHSIDHPSSDAVLIVEVHGEKLVVEPSCVDGLLDRLSKIESPEEHLGNNSYDLSASAGSRYSDHSALIVNCNGSAH